MIKYYGFVYMWVNTHPMATKHTKYIGQHRGHENDGYVGSGAIFTRRYYSKKYKGFWKRTILEYCNSQEELNEAEIKHIKIKNAQNSSEYCNIRAGGESGGKLSKAQRLKISKRSKGRTPWNKGLKLTPQTPTLVKKRIAAYSVTRQRKKEKDLKIIMQHVKKKGYIRRKDIAEVLNRSVSCTIITNRLNELVKRNKLKKVYFDKWDLRYVPPGFSLDVSIEENIINYIKHTPKCQSRDIKSYVAIKCNVTPNKIRTVLKHLVQSNIVTKEQGYKTKLYSI